MMLSSSASTGSAFYIIPLASCEVHGDFDRDGSLKGNSAERRARIIRPGAIVLPNLDVDGALPVATPGTRPPDLTIELDALNEAIDPGNDADEMTVFKVCSPASTPFGADGIKLIVSPEDSLRVRIFDTSLGATSALPVIGGSGSRPSHFIALNSSSWQYPFAIEGLTIPGCPGVYSPSGPSPLPPLPGPSGLGSSAAGVRTPANTGDRTQPVYPVRMPGDIWLEIGHTAAGTVDPDLAEVALFTLAPFMLLSNICRAETVYVMYRPEYNHDFVYDLAEALRSAFGGGVQVPADTGMPFASSRPPNFIAPPGAAPGRAANDHLYIIDGTLYPFDQWVQDEFEMGYCIAPHGYMHVVLHCKRGRELQEWVRRELPGRNVGLYERISGNGDSLNYGGNLEVSPPVRVATPAQAPGAAGPAIPAHPASPFGKILVGDSATRPIDADFASVLDAQKVQPVVRIDTSWLAVAHIDEIVSFVPASSGKGFKMLIASVLMAHRIFEAVKALPASRRTPLFRGKRWHRSSIPKTAAGSINAEITVEQLLSRAKSQNENISKFKLVPIEIRLKSVLKLDESDIIRIPVYFDAKPPGKATAAFTPGMVNMLVIGTHAIIAKPFGPRLSESDILMILRNNAGLSGATSALVSPLKGHYFWAKNAETTADIAAMFGVTEAKVLRHPKNARLAARTITPVRRIFIPEDTIDILEAYVAVALAAVGVTAHFVDDWDSYHTLDGEVHCATNVKRIPPETAPGYSGPKWWDNYESML